MVRQKQPSMIGELASLFKAAALLLCVGLFAFVGYHITEWWTAPEPRPTMQDIEAALFWAEFRKWLVILSAVFFGSITLIYVAIRLNRYRVESAYIRPDKNGNMPALPFSYSTTDDFGHKHTYKGWVDLEKMTEPGMQLHMNGTVKAETFGGSTDGQQTQIARQVTDRRHRSAEQAQAQRTAFIGGNTPTKGKAPTVAQLRAQAGVYDAERERVSIQTQLLEQKLSAPVAQPTVAEPMEEKVLTPIPPIDNAIKHSEPNKWIMGANEQRQLVTFAPKQDGHLAIFGSNGSGKTKSSAQMAAKYALKFGWNVIALDGKGGVDWLRFGKAGIMHAHVLDGDNIDYFIDCISDEMDHRYRMLSDLDYESLHEAHSQRELLHVPKTLIIFEELGANVLGSPEPRETAKQLGVLMRKLRASGIHLVLIEQSPDKGMLTNGIKSNAKYLVYNLPGHQGKVVNASDNVKYLEPGRFECNGDEYQAWNVYEDAPLAGAVEWPDLFGVAPSEVAKEITAELPQNSDKLQRAIDYQIANPDASKAEVMKACKVSDYTVSQARRMINNL